MPRLPRWGHQKQGGTARAKDYAFWMFIAALANLPAQSMIDYASIGYKVKQIRLQKGITQERLAEAALVDTYIPFGNWCRNGVMKSVPGHH